MTGTSACGGNDRDVVGSRTTTICAPGFGRGPWPTMVAFPVDAAGVSAGAASCTGGGVGFEQPAASASVASRAKRRIPPKPLTGAGRLVPPKLPVGEGELTLWRPRGGPA